MLSWIRGLFGGVNKTLDTLDVSGNKKAEIKNELAKIQSELSGKYIELAKAELDARAEMVKAEAGSANWLQSSWRPICSMALILIVVLDSFQIVVASEQLYTLATAFLGLYGSGRSLEKAAKAVKLGK